MGLFILSFLYKIFSFPTFSTCMPLEIRLAFFLRKAEEFSISKENCSDLLSKSFSILLLGWSWVWDVPPLFDGHVGIVVGVGVLVVIVGNP